jgi:hypothetical protein
VIQVETTRKSITRMKCSWPGACYCRGFNSLDGAVTGARSMTMRAHRLLWFGGVIAASSTMLLAAPMPALAQEWQWNVTPYVWASNLGVKLSTDARQIVDRDLAFSDLLKDVDMTAQARLEAQCGRHGLFVDFFGNRLSKDSQVSLAQMGGAPASLSSSVRMAIIDAGGVFNPAGDRQGLTVFYGSRILIQRASVDAQITVPQTAVVSEHKDLNQTKVDALAGARFSQRLTGGLTALMHADVSAGGTKYTWSGSAGLAYVFGGSRYTLIAGYRRMQIKLDGDSSTEGKLTLSGIVTGVNIRF